MTIPHLPPEQYELIFKAGYEARVVLGVGSRSRIPKNPYHRFEQPCEYRAWLRGFQAGVRRPSK